MHPSTSFTRKPKKVLNQHKSKFGIRARALHPITHLLYFFLLCNLTVRSRGIWGL